MIEGALDFAIACVAVALVLTAWRLLAGPEATDRVLALDTLAKHNSSAYISLTEALRQDSIISSASARFKARGFSQTTCLPA